MTPSSSFFMVFTAALILFSHMFIGQLFWRLWFLSNKKEVPSSGLTGCMIVIVQYGFMFGALFCFIELPYFQQVELPGIRKQLKSQDEQLHNLEEQLKKVQKILPSEMPEPIENEH